MQIGDRKMDSGALEPGETLDEDFDIEKDFLPEELIWLMDELLNREVCSRVKDSAVLTTGRLLGSWATRCLKHCSLQSISTDYCTQTRSLSRKALLFVVAPRTSCPCRTKSSELTVYC